MDNNRYGSFLENYNKGNTFFDRVAQGFFEKISFDTGAILKNSNNKVLKEKFGQIDKLLNDPYRSSYDKVMDLANVIDDANILSTKSDKDDKKNVANIVSGLLEVARSTEDSYLIEKSLRIAQQLIDPPK